MPTKKTDGFTVTGATAGKMLVFQCPGSVSASKMQWENDVGKKRLLSHKLYNRLGGVEVDSTTGIQKIACRTLDSSDEAWCKLGPKTVLHFSPSKVEEGASVQSAACLEA